jgi:hypothetical protein
LNAWIRCFDTHIPATSAGQRGGQKPGADGLGGSPNSPLGLLQVPRLAAILELPLPIADGEILLRGSRVHELHLRIAQIPGRAVDRDTGKRRAPARNCRPSAATDLRIALGEPASDAIRTTARTRH